MTLDNLKKQLEHAEEVGRKDLVNDILKKYPNLKLSVKTKNLDNSKTNNKGV